MKRVLMFLTLAVACGQAPQPSQDASPEGTPILAAAPSPGPCTTAQCVWNDLGSQPMNTAPTSFEGVSLNVAQGFPMVAWDEGIGDSNAFVRVKTGPTWEAATRLNDTEDGSSPALARAAVGSLAPVVAFSERRDSRNDSVIRLKTRTVVNGASVWKPFDPQSDIGLGAFNTPGSVALNPTVVSIPNLTFVAWEELAPNGEFEIFAQFFRNGVWKNLGTRADGSVDIGSSPKLAVNANNRMALTYFQDSPLGGRAVVRRWGGSTFDPVPDPSALGVDRAALGIASTGEPIVALPEFPGGAALPKLVVRQRTGHGPWLQLGAPLNVNPAANVDHISVVASGDQISVAWRESVGDVDLSRSLFVKRWNPTTQTWVLLGGTISTDRDLRVSSLALFPDGGPLVAFSQSTDNLGHANLHVKSLGVAKP
jgi:hypothetical protein